MATPLHEIHPNLDQNSLIFASVFSIPSLNYTTPTPIATPNLSSTPYGQSFGGFGSQRLVPTPSNPAAQHVKKNIAWSNATRFLHVLRQYEGGKGGAGLNEIRPEKGVDVVEALQYLLVGEGSMESWDNEQVTSQNLIEWYMNDVRSHFAKHFDLYIQETWAQPVECSEAWNVITTTLKILERAQALYVQPLVDHVFPILRAAETQSPGRAAHIEAKSRQDIHSMFLHQLPAQRLSKTLSYVLYDAGCKLFRLHMDSGNEAKGNHGLRKSTFELLKGLKEVGLGKLFAQRAFAHAMDKLMGEFVVSHYVKVDWHGRKPVTIKLRQWVKEGFTPFVKLVLGALEDDRDTGDGSGSGAVGDETEIQQWQEMAIGRLGRARVDNLFDFIVRWDQSMGAILDLKEYITNNADRAYLIVSFIGQLHRRLLRAGTTTTHILDIYIYVIRAFQELEPRGVLLNRVAQPIRHYLRDRPDTARVIVSSLLADVVDEEGNKITPGGDLSVEIASEMQKPLPSPNEHDEDLNWNDMNWIPEPQDAGPEYRSSKNDVISYLMTLYDREEFITELKNILGEHLLKNDDSEFEKERRLLELFKLRLGDEKLQACEVMLKDVEESKRINTLIHKNTNPPPQLPQVSTQILSSFFWPQLRDDTFLVPPPIRNAQEHYSRGFEKVKDMRKLRWLHALGKVEIELQLEDRKVEIECGTWQASIIYAFEQQQGEPSRVGGVLRTVEKLEDMLEMDEALVRSALTFWVGERVIAPHPSTIDAFSVLERLPSASSSTDDSAAAVAAEMAKAEQAAAAGVVTSQNLLDKNRELYEQFVVGMLTNQGSMPKMRILMMLKMAVPGGFPGGAEELGWLLEGLEEKGRTVGGGGDTWGVKR